MKRVFETGLEKLGRIIASQHNIRIVFRGQGASTDGKTIYLPSTSDLTPELMQDMHGFLDHEVAHCRFTDFEQLDKLMPGRGGKFQKDLLNACEDSRIEILQIEDLPGCALNLDPLNEKYRGLAEAQPARSGGRRNRRAKCKLTERRNTTGRIGSTTSTVSRGRWRKRGNWRSRRIARA